MKKLILTLIVFNIVLTCNCLFNSRYPRNVLYLDEESEPKPEADPVESDHFDDGNERNNNSADDDDNNNNRDGGDNLNLPFWNNVRLSRQFNSNRTLFFKPRTRAPLLNKPIPLRARNLPSSSTIKPIIKVTNAHPKPSLSNYQLPLSTSSTTIAPKNIIKVGKRLIPSTIPTTSSTTTTTSTTTSTTSTTTTTTTESPAVTGGSVLIMSNDSEADLGFDFTTSLITGPLLAVGESDN